MPREQDTDFADFEAFWPFYLREHSHPVNRALHVAGTAAGVTLAGVAVATLNPLLLPAAFVAGYGPAWVGHFVVEGNVPATFEHPLWSFRGDFRMCRLALTGRLGPHLEAALAQG